MKVIANRQITGEYGTALPGQTIEVRDELAEDLMRRNLVRTSVAPRVLYDTKVIQPLAPEVSARSPFRDVSLPNAGPSELATQGDRVLAEADLSGSGAIDSLGRARGARSAARR